MNEKNVTITKQKSYTVIDLFWEELRGEPLDLEDKHALYQICGYHVVYGNDTLLYIGKTERFSDRILEHRWIDYEQAISIRKALFRSKTEEISDIENLLIFSHSPAYNSSRISGDGRNLNPNMLIRNYGEKGVLLPEISGAYWRDFYNEKDGYRGWAKQSPQRKEGPVKHSHNTRSRAMPA